MAGYALQVLEGNFGEEELEDYFGKEPLELPRQSLYEATEALFRHFADSFPAEEQVFIQAFLDMVEEYAEKENADMGRFLAWWDETGCRRTIATPDTQNAIRVLTVHKSKGLGFKAVIVPFCDWEIDHKPLKPVVLWCHPDRAPFDRLRLVPVRYGQGLGGTIFARDYFDEKSRAFIDNLNTLYVAFTRSKEELIAFAPCPKKGKDGKAGKVSSIAGLLWAGTHTDIATTRTGDQLVSLSACFSDEYVFEMGNWWRPSPKKEENPEASAAKEGLAKEPSKAEQQPAGLIVSVAPIPSQEVLLLESSRHEKPAPQEAVVLFEGKPAPSNTKKWRVRYANKADAVMTFSTQEEAIAYARSLASKNGSVVRVRPK